ncbi:MAG: polysaccharide pyruvyl transferase family protein [Blastocatellia bacterium]
MRDRNWQIALFGTFDVENYGDLLFPIIAEAELTKRLGPVTLRRFSYNARTQPDWPYTVTSVIELPETACSLDGVLIGGGSIIRFDKVIEIEYAPPTPTIHHPTGYWLTPALIALQHGIPLIWNAPGMHGDNIPLWAAPLMEQALQNSRYIAVRDESSQAVLARFVDKSRIAVLPDTAFGISRLIDERRPSDEFSRLRAASDLTDPYIIVQAIGGLDSFLRLVRDHSRLFRGCRILVLPIGPVLGDHESVIGDDLPGLVRLPVWPHPLLLAELISQAAAVVGHSYHLAVTALAFGVPVFCSADLSFWKYTALSGFETIYPLPKEAEIDPHWFTTRLGKTRPSQAAFAALDQLEHHWDHIAAILCEGATATQPALNRFWQSLPNMLEAADEVNKLLVQARAEIEARDDRIATLYKSPSMRVTAPLRFLMRNLKHLMGK